MRKGLLLNASSCSYGMSGGGEVGCFALARELGKRQLGTRRHLVGIRKFGTLLILEHTAMAVTTDVGS